VASDGARRGFIRQLLQYELKQNPAVYGHDAIAKLDAAFTASGHHVRNLLVEINALAARHGIASPDQARR
jgi:hypothetical protein